MIDSSAYGAALAERLARMPGGVCGSENWLLLHANDALRDILEMRRGASLPSAALSHWLGQGVLEGFHEAETDSVAGAPGARGRMIFRHPRGASYLFYWWGDVSKDHGPVRCFTVYEIPLDELDQTARLSWRELDSVLEFIHDGIWVIDAEGVTRRVNRAMERIAGIKAEEVVGRHVTEPLREGRFKTCVTLRALKARHTVTLFDDYSNGKRCLNTSTPVFDENGKVWRVIAAIRDVTELETLQKRLSNLEVEAMAYKLRAQGLESEANSGLMGQSLLLHRVRQDIVKAAHSDAVTLILGETGTGKSMAAKIIHDMSARAEKPFVVVNCGAMPPALMESELFGYEGGAFTGASKGGKPGMLELASGGTLLLDEIGELSLPMQVKLLHVLDGQPFYRVGGTRAIAVDTRVIAATNKPLDKMVASGQFREDLFYRLRVLNVDMPPLRERKDDILLLAWHFLRKISEGTGTEKHLDPRTEQLFLAYNWPGNVRELQSVIQSLVTLTEADNIVPDDLPSYMRESAGAPRVSRTEQSLTRAVEALEKSMLETALAEAGSTYKAARRLGISQSSVVRKAKKYGIHAEGETRDARAGVKSAPAGDAPALDIT
ncbi:PAS domain S-box protein [Desulfovibrio sp. PG-178-WT-4]|uniref:HTH-type transcriptional regulatory protein TyrR n=1 Tax=Desulfovibrio porci TaxID=2605782 RepID=A0A6L5XIT9_9BACT|nr:sigma 54-interacting transcriptional regulator [Desulfovibrio porci]MDY3809677.1 sigma 54-interacting transcriptional regulator [Desulfovibrio porci]MSS26961.1 PAS domain S-box protein [Desulfovibrio porci]